jgi:GPN-loop GTPase
MLNACVIPITGSMLSVECPFITLLTKMDLLSKKDKKRLESYLEPDSEYILGATSETPWNSKFLKLTAALGQVLDNYNLIKFYPFDWRKEDNIESMLLMVDITLGVSEDADVKVKDFDEIPEENEENEED